MYLHLGNGISVPTDDIIGIFDLDNASSARSTRDFLRTAEEEGMIVAVPGAAGSGSISPLWLPPPCWAGWSPCYFANHCFRAVGAAPM